MFFFCVIKIVYFFCLSTSLFDVVFEYFEFVVEFGFSGYGFVSGSFYFFYNGVNLFYIFFSRVNFINEKDRLRYYLICVV